MKKHILLSSAAAVAVIAFGGVYALWGPKWPRASARDSTSPEAKAPSEEPPMEVVIPAEKFATMKISSVSVTKQKVQDERTVPGLIAYRHVSRVDLKAPVDSVIEKVLVKPGDRLKEGEKLATLTSPDVGLARAEVEKSASELRIANQALEWAEQIAQNLDELLKFLRGKPAAELVDTEFDDKLLGDQRQAVLPAYSKYLLADKLSANAQESLRKGAISEQVARQRESDREVARQQFLAAREQSRFNARQAREKARQAQTYARRLVDIAQRKLETLLGGYSKIAIPAESDAAEGAALTRFDLIAPFPGTVEERWTSDSQRVAAGTLLFTFANTDVLEVEADVREGDWQAVSSYFERGGGEKLKVRVPFGGKDREFEATVAYVGRAVDPDSRAVAIHAEFDNSKLKFKPGMRAWIAIPAGKPQEALVVPPAALRTHDKQDFVFVEDQEVPRRFQRVDVKIGKRTAEWVTIASGLTAGQRVVVNGAFLLKSELLLEPEEE